MERLALFFDIDDCLIHTSALGEKHLQALTASLTNLGIKKPDELSRRFAVLFHTLYDEHQGKYLTLEKQKTLATLKKLMAQLEKPVMEKYGEMKRWSREVMIMIAAQQSGVSITGTQCMRAADALWEEITRQADFYPDALPFIRKMLADKIPLYLISSSDSRLTFNDKTKLFEYDPDYSRKLKLQRLQKFVQLGFPAEQIFIGDPIDKPNPRIFKLALNHARAYNIEHKTYNKKQITNNQQLTTIMVGDSVKNDLLPAKEAGFDRLIFLNRTGHTQKLPEFVEEIKKLDELLTQLKSG